MSDTTEAPRESGRGAPRNYREYTTVDKSGWHRGEWDGEPDKVQWIDDETELDCLVVRGPGGHWCGYVGVPPEHPLSGVGYDDERVSVDVHGGLTFADACNEPTEEEFASIPGHLTNPTRIAEAAKYPTGDAAERLALLRREAAMTLEEWREFQQARRICHLPEPGRTEVWWFGFDCAHSGDLSPKYLKFYEEHGLDGRREWESYKNRAYVEGEVRSLARQLARAQGSSPRTEGPR